MGPGPASAGERTVSSIQYRLCARFQFLLQFIDIATEGKDVSVQHDLMPYIRGVRRRHPDIGRDVVFIDSLAFNTGNVYMDDIGRLQILVEWLQQT